MMTLPQESLVSSSQDAFGFPKESELIQIISHFPPTTANFFK